MPQPFLIFKAMLSLLYLPLAGLAASTHTNCLSEQYRQLFTSCPDSGTLIVSTLTHTFLFSKL